MTLRADSPYVVIAVPYHYEQNVSMTDIGMAIQCMAFLSYVHNFVFSMLYPPPRAFDVPVHTVSLHSAIFGQEAESASQVTTQVLDYLAQPDIVEEETLLQAAPYDFLGHDYLAGGCSFCLVLVFFICCKASW